MKLINLIFIPLILTGFSGISLAQFGPIGYDFQDPYIEFDDLQFAVRLSTNNNIYCPDQKSLTVDKSSPGKLTLSCTALSAAGGQISSPGKIELQIIRLGDSQLSISANASHPSEICKTILVLIKGIEVNALVSEYSN